MATRKKTSEPFGEPVKLPPHVNTEPYRALYPNLSPDGSTLYFCSNRPGGFGDSDIWQVPIIPIVDFNGDEIVNTADLLRLIEFWGQDDSSVDIGPMPWGDGVVDEKDLEVLMNYWGQEIPNPALIAHWSLDEAEGVVAVDSAGSNDGVLVGNPIWQPTGGTKGGALLFDGVDDYISTGKVLDPGAGPFSVFAWVKGAAPNQAILAQADGAIWLMASPSGTLMTMLKGSSRTAGPLVSPAVIIDGAWHQVGLAWDGERRILYVDGVEVVKDTQPQGGLVPSAGGLHLGAEGTALVPFMFWSGLIDDVRIYDRAVKP